MNTKILMFAYTISLLTPTSVIPVFAQQGLPPDFVTISTNCIVMPVDWFLLVEREPFWGAVKFFGNTKKPDGMHSKYECFQLGKEKGAANKIGEGEVIFKETSSKGSPLDLFLHKGIGSAFGPRLKIDKIRLCAHAAGLDHATVYFWSRPTTVDQKVRLAPTPWRHAGEIDPSDKRIQWVANNENREPKNIPIATIWDKTVQ